MNPSWLRLLSIGALALLPQFAHAQYSWIDEKGVRVFSDRPPPPGTPPNRILKAPRMPEPLPLESAAPAPAPMAAAPAKAAIPSDEPTPAWKRQEAEYRMRAAQLAELERKAEIEKKERRKAECAWARDAQRKLDTAHRLVLRKANGEDQYLSGEARDREQEKVQGILRDCPQG